VKLSFSFSRHVDHFFVFYFLSTFRLTDMNAFLHSNLRGHNN
jgi:hypothetical protein